MIFNLKYFFLLLLLLFLASCSENDPLNDKEFSCQSTSEDEGRILLEAFKNNSSSLMNRFFERWERQCIPTESFVPGDIRNKIYSLFSAFYTELADYRDSEYLVLQNSIEYCLVKPPLYDSNFISLPDSVLQKATIEYFTPYPSKLNKKIVYLSNKYSEALNFYVNETTVTSPYYDYTKISFEYQESKVNFLKRKILIQRGEWTPAYYYFSFPYIYRIYFNPDATKAKVYYRDSWYSGGMDEYQYSNSGWKKIRNIFRWIE
jgi:hypothetical protein